MRIVTSQRKWPKGALRNGRSGMLMAELYAALAIFSMLVLAVAAPLTMDQSVVRQMTVRAVAMQIVDGETEVLASGAWRSFPTGEQDYPVSCESAKGLPKGRFVLSIDSSIVRLEWREQKSDGREIVRVQREFRRQP